MKDTDYLLLPSRFCIDEAEEILGEPASWIIKRESSLNIERILAERDQEERKEKAQKHMKENLSKSVGYYKLNKVKSNY